MKSIAYRLFKVGQMPPPLTTLSSTDGVLLADQGVPVGINTRGMRWGGYYARRGVARRVGSVVVTGNLIALAIEQNVALYAPYHPEAWGPLTFTIEGDGLHLLLDIEHLLPRLRGTLEVHAKVETGQVLDLPTKPQSIDITPEQARHLMGRLAPTPFPRR